MAALEELEFDLAPWDSCPSDLVHESFSSLQVVGHEAQPGVAMGIGGSSPGVAEHVPGYLGSQTLHARPMPQIALRIQPLEPIIPK